MKVVTIIQARSSSSRLRNKVLLNFNGKTLLGQVIECAKSIVGSDEIWIATSENKEDDIIELICEDNNVNCFRGSLKNVRSRFENIAKKTKANIIVRITGDNPFTEPTYVNQMISYIKSHREVDYLNMDKSMILDGTGSEVFSSKSFYKSIEMSESKDDLEHVTPALINNNIFKKFVLKPDNIKYIAKKPYFLGVDTFDDYVRNVNILNKYSGFNTLKKIINKLNNNEKIF